MSTSNLIVIFGTGPVGLSTAKELLVRGKRVKAVNRSGKLSADQLAVLKLTESEQARLELAACDLVNQDQVIQTSRGAEAIVHAANPPDYTTWERDLPVWQRHLIQAALVHKVPLGVTENLYSYAADIMPMTEKSRVAPRTKKGKLRERLHQELITAQKESGLKWVSVRASDFYGPGCTMQSYFGDRFFPQLYAGKTPALIGKLDQPHSYCYTGDFGKAIATVLLEPSAHGRVWFAPHSAPKTGAEMSEYFFERYASQTGGRRPAKAATIPSPMIRLLGIFSPLLREVSEMLFEFDHPFTVDSREFEKTFGIKATPYETGVAETFAWMDGRKART